MDRSDHTYCFVHVMKTAGRSFTQYMRENLPPDSVYPNGRTRDGANAKYELDRLAALPADRRLELRAYALHCPAYVADVVGATRTITVLRHPVDRTISWLKQWQRKHAPDLTLEQIYDEPLWCAMFLREHQTKIFALTPADRGNSYMAVLDVDEARFDAACARLAGFDVVGVQEDFPGLLSAVQERFGWAPPTRERREHPGAPGRGSEALRDRVARENPWDMAFYDYAVRLVADADADRRQ